MRVVIFCHSLASDWNHGNAHFLRGVARELLLAGHAVASWEPADAWSAQHLVAERGPAALDGWRRAYPDLDGVRHVYASGGPDDATLDAALDGAALVLVHEWSDQALVRRLGARRAAGAPWRLLFHDTHHRSVTERDAMAGYDLAHYDGVLAFGEAVREVYLREGWAARAWTWHEAADHRLFRPMPAEPREGDLVWVGNWGDDERTEELREFLVEPVHDLGLRARIHGVRYPDAARAALAAAGIEYAGWLPNHEAPRAFARFAVTVHVPRRPYVRALPGVPTIRVFEALASGIPLVSAPWDDAEGLFAPGEDYLVAQDGADMRRQLRAVLADADLARALAERGRETILARHTCAHRVAELLAVARELGLDVERRASSVERRGIDDGASDAGQRVRTHARRSPLAAHRSRLLPMNIAFFGSSLVSAYWNGAATYYRGIVRALHARGHHVTFYEPDAYGRQQHRDIADPDYARVVVYAGEGADGVSEALEDARDADLIVKASGVGVFDELLEREVPALRRAGNLVAFWDVDAPATLERVHGDAADPFRALIPRYDLVLTYGGGDPVVAAYAALGARQCLPIYNALDPATHHPEPPQPRFASDLAFLANRLPDREARVDEFFFRAAAAAPDRRFLLGGNGWDDRAMPANVAYVGHVYTSDHNALNCSALAVLNVHRDSMVRNGWSPATRLFEAAGGASCQITDAWQGIEEFLEPGTEVLVAEDGEAVAAHLESLTPARARAIGDAAFRRVMAAHTYGHRAAQVEAVLEGAASVERRASSDLLPDARRSTLDAHGEALR